MIEFILEGGRRTSLNPAAIAYVTERDDACSFGDGYNGPLTAIGLIGDGESHFTVRGHYGEILEHLKLRAAATKAREQGR